MKTDKIKLITIEEMYYPVPQSQHEKNEIFRKKINEIIKEINNGK